MTLAEPVDKSAGSSAAVISASRAGAASLLILPALFGGYVAGGALHDPDTCWLLKLGGWILEHGQLPQTDPFSYTYALVWDTTPPVLYQWLSEVIFFIVYQQATLSGLLALCAVMLVLAFFALPLRVLCREGMGISSAAGLALLMVLTASFHFLARPEIFSYLLTAISVERLAALDNRSHGDKTQWTAVLTFFLLMVLWCNLHSGFVIGLILMAVYALSSVFALFLAPDTGKANKTALVSLAASLAATLINPWGVGLWAYLPRLFFPDFNKHIVELQPVMVADFADPIFWPYLLLMTAATVIAVRNVRATGRRDAQIFGLIALLLAASGLACRRLVPFAALYVLAALASIYRANTKPEAAAARQGFAAFRRNCEKEVEDIVAPLSVRWPVGACLMAALGAVLMSTSIIPPQLPQGSRAFQPPGGAIDFLSRSMPPGRVLNDAQFGDVMIWHLSPCPPVFIDTRYDMYGETLVADYRSMTNCTGEWRRLLGSYEIAWLFLKPDSRLAKCLEGEQGWKVVYSDEAAIVMSRED